MTNLDATLAVTMGDPFGIGPEIIAKMFLRRPDQRHWLVVGDPLVMEYAIGQVDAGAKVRPIAKIGDARFDGRCLDVLASSHLTCVPPVGQISAAIVTAIELARSGHVRGIDRPARTDCLGSARRRSGFTIGTAALDGKFPADSPCLCHQLRAISDAVH
jgi:4-hydroxythreonine-4-phosphate dehydrogenase